MAENSSAPESERLPRSLWWLLAGLTFAWGFNWTAMKVALSEIGPWTFRSLCLSFGAVVLFAVLRAPGRTLGVPRGYWNKLWLLAFFNITCWNALIAIGLTMIPSGRAAILAYTMPAWSIPLSVWMLGERFTARRLLGLACGMGGIALLLAESFEELGKAPLGALLVLGAAAAWGVGAVLQRKYPLPMAAGPYTAWMMVLGGVPIFLGALLLEDFGALGAIGVMPVLGVIYNIIVAFAWAYWAWNRIVTSVPVGVSSLATLLIPVVGVFSGMLFLGERPSWAEYAALLLVTGSLLSVMLPARR